MFPSSISITESLTILPHFPFPDYPTLLFPPTDDNKDITQLPDQTDVANTANDG